MNRACKAVVVAGFLVVVLFAYPVWRDVLVPDVPVHAALPGERHAGRGFFSKNVSFRRGEVLGEMTNRSGWNSASMFFVLNVYAGDGAPVGSTLVIITDFKDGMTKTFGASPERCPAEGFTYTLRYDHGLGPNDDIATDTLGRAGR